MLKLQDEIYQRESVGYRFIITTGNKINESFSFTTNWIITHSGNNDQVNYGYVLNLSYVITDKIGAFMELYGNLNNFNADIDMGISYLLNDDLQLDTSFGLQGEKNVSNWFVDAGISWRFDWRSDTK